MYVCIELIEVITILKTSGDGRGYLKIQFSVDKFKNNCFFSSQNRCYMYAPT